MECTPLEELWRLHSEVGPDVRSRLADFSRLWASGTEEEMYAELVFCLLTPQSRATSCWAAVEDMRFRGVLLTGSAEDILLSLSKVRFKYKKSIYVEASRKVFLHGESLGVRQVLVTLGKPENMRLWLVENIKGIGLKEAGHFLRNIGLGEDLAILDRHILKNLVCLGVLDSVPPSMTPNVYFNIESRMRVFSSGIGMSMGELDLILWYKEAGEVFK